MTHAHSHHHGGHDHGHHHGSPETHGRTFAITIALNSLFVVAEFGYGILANSTALLADAGHNLSDVLGLLLAWGATLLARKAPDQRYTYGLHGSSILAALGNAMLLLVASGAIGWEALRRFAEPPPVAGVTVMTVASIGILINGISAWLFMKGAKGDLNIRGAYLHMAADTAVSIGVVIAGAAILYTGWYWLDPVISLAIVAVILFGTLGLLKESLQLAINAVPAHIDTAEVADYLRAYPGVSELHDLHIWGTSTTSSALTAHLVIPQISDQDAVLADIAHTLEHRFSIAHTTLQIECRGIDHQCSLDSGAGHHRHP